MELKGRLKLIEETQEFGTNGFKKRQFVLTTIYDQYPQDILIELHQDKCSLIDAHNINDDLTVQINIRGREWTNQQGEVKYFNSIVGWKIEPALVEETGEF